MPSKAAPPGAFGRYLRGKRLNAGLSLREVANAIGVSHVFLGEVERGVRASLKRERWQRLQDFLPGFSIEEAERILLPERPYQLSLENAPPAYQDLGLALARRIEKRNLKQSEFDELLRILRGRSDDDD